MQQLEVQVRFSSHREEFSVGSEWRKPRNSRHEMAVSDHKTGLSSKIFDYVNISLIKASICCESPDFLLSNRFNFYEADGSQPMII